MSDLMTSPLSGIRVIAVEQYGAGPWATLQLADLGADVIKIEDPATGGDVGRYVPPFQVGEDSLFFETFNRNKRSVVLDLRQSAGRSVFEDLVRESQVVFANLRGDQPKRLGLRFEDLSAVNPRIVCCSLSGFGTTGPRASEGGYDYVLQGLAGWMSLTGDPDGPPTRSGLPLVDLSAGYVCAIAMLAGVRRAEQSGEGCDCDISLFETALSELVYIATWAASAGYQPSRRADSAHPSIVPFQTFETADDRIVVAGPKEKFWTALCDVLEVPHLADDPRFTDFAARDEHRAVLVPLLEERFATRPTAFWLDKLAEAGIPAGPVNDVSAALADPQVEARNVLVDVQHPRLGLVRQIASPIRLTGVANPVGRAPFYGEHTEEVLASVCDYTPAQIEELRGSGAFGVVESGPEDELSAELGRAS